MFIVADLVSLSGIDSLSLLFDGSKGLGRMKALYNGQGKWILVREKSRVFHIKLRVGTLNGSTTTFTPGRAQWVVHEDWGGIEWLLVGTSPQVESLCCVLEQDTFSAA